MCRLGKFSDSLAVRSAPNRRLPALRQAVERALNAGAREIVLDFADVAAIDAEGVGALVEQRLRTVARGATLRIVRVRCRVWRLLTLARVDQVIDTSAFDMADCTCERRRRSA